MLYEVVLLCLLICMVAREIMYGMITTRTYTAYDIDVVAKKLTEILIKGIEEKIWSSPTT